MLEISCNWVLGVVVAAAVAPATGPGVDASPVQLPEQGLTVSLRLLVLRAVHQLCSACSLLHADLHSAVLCPLHEEPDGTDKLGAAWGFSIGGRLGT